MRRLRLVKEYFEKKHKVTPGIIAGIHTFGSRIHMLVILKLIRRKLKMKGNVKEHLGYIGRYMRRPAIAVSRIEEYNGEYVTCRYLDKTDGEEKREKITLEEFIGRLIRHIPDEHVKTIRYYGVYSRRKRENRHAVRSVKVTMNTREKSVLRKGN